MRIPIAATAAAVLAFQADAKVPGPDSSRKLSGFSGSGNCDNFAGVYFNLDMHTQVSLYQDQGACNVRMRQHGARDSIGYVEGDKIEIQYTVGEMAQVGGRPAIQWPVGYTMRGVSYKDCPPEGWTFHVADAGAAWWEDSSKLVKFTMSSAKCKVNVDLPSGRKTWEVRAQKRKPSELLVFDENQNHRGVLTLNGASVSYTYALVEQPPAQMTPCADSSSFHDEVAYERCHLRWRPGPTFCSSVGCRYELRGGRCTCPDEGRCKNIGGTWQARRCSEDMAEYQSRYGWDPVVARDEEAALRHVQNTCHRWDMASHMQMLADKCCRGAASVCGATENQCLSASTQKVNALAAKGYHLSACRDGGAR